MIKYPKVGRRVFIHYNKKIKDEMPFHGKTGIIIKVSTGRGPRNILVLLDWPKKIVSFPRGNLNLCSGE